MVPDDACAAVDWFVPRFDGLLLRDEMSVRDCAVTIPDSTPRRRTAGAIPTAVSPEGLGFVPLSPNQVFLEGGKKIPLAGRTGNKSRSSKSRLIVLVVDDVHDVTEMIELFLKHAGYDVSTAESAKTALRLAGEQPFDLVISDIGMPAMNGYELAEALRRLPDYRDIPMIAVTGYTEYDDRARSLQAGFNAHLTKPIDPSQLMAVVNDLLS